MRTPALLTLLTLLTCLASCNPFEQTPQLSALDVAQPVGWDEQFELMQPVDMNPDPNILEIEFDARVADIEVMPGTTTQVWTYDGSLPGPLIRAKVGDRLIVHFRNNLPEATSIHWHGLRVSNDMDGVPGVTQDPIEPGGEFRYEFILRDAGTYWYHPHINSAAQVGWGMYGPLIVEDPNDSEAFGDDIVILLSDMSLNEDGDFLPPDQGGDFGDLFGREGSVLLVNGRVEPQLRVRQGKPQRWRIINAARARYFDLRVPDHMFVKIGGDNGLAARSESSYRVLVTPGERADLVFTPVDAPGSSRTVQWIPTDRGYGTTFGRSREPLFHIATVDEAAVVPAMVPTQLREIELIDTSDAIHTTLDMTIDLSNNDVVMGFNGVPYWEMQPLEARIGETHLWTLRNPSAFAHPFHLHGFFFQVVDAEAVPEWKDTVNVAAEEEVLVAVQFTERPGVWMYHCHILDHAEVGMMGQLSLVE